MRVAGDTGNSFNTLDIITELKTSDKICFTLWGAFYKAL